MDDLGELKGRVARATRALSERDAEEQGRHAKLIALVAALEAKSLEARRDKERAELRLSEVETENEELRRLLVSLLDAVEAGSRSRFADAIYALEARIGSLSERAATAVPEQEASEAETGPDHAFTAELAASCAVEEELAAQAEEQRTEAAEDSVTLLERIRAQLCQPDAPQDAMESEGDHSSTGQPQDGGDTADEAPEDGASDLDASGWERRRAAR